MTHRNWKMTTFAAGLLTLTGLSAAEPVTTPVEWVKHPRVKAAPDGVLTLTGKRTDLAGKAFKLDPDKTYRFRMEIRRTPGAAPAKCYIGNWSIKDGVKMQPQQVMAARQTESVLTAEAKAGDKVITIKRPKMWAANFKTKRWGVVFDARDGLADLPNPTYNAIQAAEAGKDTVKLTLAAPLKKDYPAGTATRFHSSGDGMYGGWKGKAVPEEWTPVEWEVCGISESGNLVSKWWHGADAGALRINANFDQESSLEVRNATITVQD